MTATSTGRGGILWTVKQGTLTYILLTYQSQGLQNVLPKKSTLRFHSVALQEDSDVEIPCAVPLGACMRVEGYSRLVTLSCFMRFRNFKGIPAV